MKLKLFWSILRRTIKKRWKTYHQEIFSKIDLFFILYDREYFDHEKWWIEYYRNPEKILEFNFRFSYPERRLEKSRRSNARADLKRLKIRAKKLRETKGRSINYMAFLIEI